MTDGDSRPKVRHRVALADTARLLASDIGSIIAMGICAFLIGGFSILAEEVSEGETARIDQTVLLALRVPGHPSDLLGPPWLEEMGRDVTALGSYVVLTFLLIATAGYLCLMRKRALAALVTTAVVGGMLISTLLKLGIDRARPDLPHAARVFTASFPSGHATLSAVTFLTLGALLARASDDRRVKAYFAALAVFLTAAVGMSRIYLGLHYPSDVVAGWLVGSAWAILCWLALLFFQRRGAAQALRVNRQQNERMAQ